MIKQNNERLTITLSKKQVCWLKNGAKKLGISTSTFIKWLIDKNITRILCNMTEEELKETIKIAKMPWINWDPTKQYEWDEDIKEWRQK